MRFRDQTRSTISTPISIANHPAKYNGIATAGAPRILKFVITSDIPPEQGVIIARPYLRSPTASGVTGAVNPRIDGEAGAGEEKGAVEAPGLFNGIAIQSDGLSVVSSV